jgi:hypothetical protein
MSASASAAASSSAPSDLAPATVQYGKRTYRAFASGSKRTYCLTHFFYSEIMTKTLERIAEVVKEKCRAGGNTAMSVGVTDGAHRFNELIEFYAEDEEKDVSIAKRTKVTELTAMTGLTKGEIPRTLKMAKSIALKFFKEPSVFAYSATPQEIDDWVMSTTLEQVRFFNTFLSLKYSQQPVAFSPEQLKQFDVTKPATQDPALMSCYAYALLQVGETRAKNQIFYKEKNQALQQVVDLLHQWKYTAVSEPMKGDLVVYFVEGKVKHMGIFTESGKVESKLGDNGGEFACTHPIFDVPITYGNQIVFFRKP